MRAHRPWLGPMIAAAVLLLGSRELKRMSPPPSAPPRQAAAEPRPKTDSPSRVSTPKKPPAPKVGFGLVDVSSSAGIRFTHAKGIYPATIAHVGPWLASIGAAVAVVDYDNDGRMDLYLTSTATGSFNALYRNNGDGTFSDRAHAAGLADVNRDQASLRPLFFDFDDDGDSDLLLSTQYCPRLFRNNGDGTFQDVTKGSGITHCAPSYASNVLDLDSDGDLDLVVGDYFPPTDFQTPSRYDFMPDSLTEADNGGEVILYRNDGDGRFRPFPGNLGVRTNGWVQSIGVWDVDGDGRSDLYLALDYNNDKLYLNRAEGLVDASDRLGNKYSRNGMNAEFAYLDGEAHPSVYVTHIYEPPYKLGGNVLWTFSDGARRAVDRAKDAGVAACGWSWGGKFADFDSDGLTDLVVTNGFISADPGKNYWYRMSTLGSASRDTIADSRNWPPFEDHSMSGFQRKCVYRNVGGRFQLVTHETGMKDDLSDGRALAVIDYRDEGIASLAAAYIGAPARLWRAAPPPGNAWIGFKLVGRKPRDAWGAVVTVAGGGRIQRRELQPANSFMSQSDPRLLFGLGPDGKAGSVTVRWPSGKTQALGALAEGRYHTLKEP